MRPGPRDFVAGAVGEHQLKELQASGLECRQRTGQIQPPHADEALVEHPGDFFAGVLESFQPMPQRLGIVQTEVFDVEDRKTMGLEDVGYFAQAREDTRQGISAVRSRDRSDADDCGRSNESIPGPPVETAVESRSQLPVILAADVLQHADRDEDVARAGDIPPVVFDEFDAIVQPFGPAQRRA